MIIFYKQVVIKIDNMYFISQLSLVSCISVKKLFLLIYLINTFIVYFYKEYTCGLHKNPENMIDTINANEERTIVRFYSVIFMEKTTLPVRITSPLKTKNISRI